MVDKGQIERGEKGTNVKGKKIDGPTCLSCKKNWTNEVEYPIQKKFHSSRGHVIRIGYDMQVEIVDKGNTNVVPVYRDKKVGQLWTPTKFQLGFPC